MPHINEYKYKYPLFYTWLSRLTAEENLPMPTFLTDPRNISVFIRELGQEVVKVYGEAARPSRKTLAQIALSSALTVLGTEIEHRDNGREHIIISKEALATIMSVTISGVRPEDVRQPFRACRWSMEGVGLQLTSQIMSIYDTCKPPTEFESHLAVVVHKARETYGTYQAPLSDAVSTASEESTGLIPALLLEGGTQAEDPGERFVTQLIIKASIFLQVHPECLQEGPYVKDTEWVKRKGKHVSTTTKRKTLNLKIGKEYKQLKNGHYARPHFRALRDPCFARQDEQGNILPAGEPGQVRIVAVKGHFRGGRLHRVEPHQQEA
jgi:hypothetical protein